MKYLVLPLLAVLGCAHASTGPKDPSAAEGAELRVELARMLIEHGDVATAIPLLRQALAESPLSAPLHELYGEALVDAAADGPAETELRRAVALAPRDARARAMLGILLGRGGRVDAAVDEERAATSLQPETAAYWNNLGFALYLAHRDRDAVAAYERSLALDPTRATVRNNLGFAWLRLGDRDRARAAFVAAVGNEGARRNLALGGSP
jgi:Flp pilus assembly protein TadD